MTRFARTNQGTTKKAGLDSTPWQTMTQATSTSSESSIHKIEKTSLKKKKKKKIAEIPTPIVEISEIPKKKKKKRRSDAPPAGTSVVEKLEEEDEINDQQNKSSKNKKESYISSEQLAEVKTKVEEMKEKVGTLSSFEEEELTEYFKKDVKRENRRLKRIGERECETVCFHCRETGHDFGNCPLASQDQDSGAGICFKCGSTEHMIHQCRLKLPQGDFPFAKCFNCNEMGHLSKQCPDNPRGLYPNGGCCHECGSVEHFVKNCLELQKKRGEEQIVLSRFKSAVSTSADAEDYLIEVKPKIIKKGPKVVKF